MKSVQILGIAGLLLVVGVGLTGYGYAEYQSQQATLDDAVEVDATVVEAQTYAVGGEFDDPDGAGGAGTAEEEVSYRLSVEYEYEFEGEEYRSSNFDLLRGSGPEYDRRSEAEAALEEYPEGGQTTAYVDPDEPGEGFLEYGIPAGTYVMLGFGAFLVLGSLWVPVAHFGPDLLGRED